MDETRASEAAELDVGAIAAGQDAAIEAEKKLYGAAAKNHEAKLARENKGKAEPALKPYPYSDGGVNENAAVRMVKMVIPNCPADPNPEILQRDGKSIPNPRYTGEPNCQQVYAKYQPSTGVWDTDQCERLGHDPWHTTFRKKVVEDVVDERPTIEVDGAEVPNPDYGYVISERVRVKSEKRLNIIQVSINPRHTSGTEMALAIARGARFLEDFGIESPCEFRNCTKKQQVDTRYGKYCSERHARLVAADFRRIMLPVGGDPYSEEQALQEREETLESIVIRKTA